MLLTSASVSGTGAGTKPYVCLYSFAGLSVYLPVCDGEEFSARMYICACVLCAYVRMCVCAVSADSGRRARNEDGLDSFVPGALGLSGTSLHMAPRLPPPMAHIQAPTSVAAEAKAAYATLRNTSASPTDLWLGMCVPGRLGGRRLGTDVGLGTSSNPSRPACWSDRTFGTRPSFGPRSSTTRGDPDSKP